VESGRLLNGAQHIVLGGHIAYIAADAGMVIVDLNDPLKPRHLATVPLDGARASALQFRYLFVTDKSGLRVIDVTLPAKPALLPGRVALADARKVYVARTYAYVAAGKQGLAIIDVEKPAEPKVYQMFDADGQLNDARRDCRLHQRFAVRLRGRRRERLKVLQLTAPDTQPRFYGFSPEPKPQLIAWSRTRTPALALSRAWTATARWMKRAARSRCSAVSVRVRSMPQKWLNCT
jgi:hypothetical protein